MNKVDTLLELLYKIYLLLKEQSDKNEQPSFSDVPEVLSREQVKVYLGISESTYKRKVRDGTLKPIKMPGGDRFFKRDLFADFQESIRRGRI